MNYIRCALRGMLRLLIVCPVVMFALLVDIGSDDKGARYEKIMAWMFRL